MKGTLLFIITCIIINEYSAGQISYPGVKSPGVAVARTYPGNSVILENDVLKIKFVNDGARITISGFEDKHTHKSLKIGNTKLFKLTMQDNNNITSDDFILQRPPEISDIAPVPDSKIYAQRLCGRRYSAILENRKLGLLVEWEADLRDGANYVRQIFTLKAEETINISKVTLIELPGDAGIEKKGTVDGSPLVHDNMFFAIEHPMNQVEQNKSAIFSYLEQLIPVTPENNITFSSVWGITPVNQLRRGFLYYLEFERSSPYHQILHYNSWYDISWADTKFNESQALDRIKMFRDSLVVKRRVHLNAFLFDDGWDDNKTLWMFNRTAFPDGFVSLKNEASSCKAGIGAWISPFGGYGIAKEMRIEYGKSQNPPFETNANGFSLTGTVYYNRFLDVTRSFIRDYDIDIFKFDGVGPGNDAKGAGKTYHSDIEAFLKLMKELKAIKPDLYLDLTTGTWPSPYWLFYGDNTWRSGDDNGQAGEGTMRQRGITYRDANTYKNVVTAGPLYPITALMNGGLIIADHGLPGKFEMNEKDLSDDIWSFFGTCVNLQELYINPHKLNSEAWDCLAKACNWAKENEHIMTDAHWVGGDPGKGEIYDYAAWSPERAVLMLRNPSGVVKSFQFSVNDIFDLPNHVKDNYAFYDARIGGKNPSLQGRLFKIDLQPFEVKVFNASLKK